MKIPHYIVTLVSFKFCVTLFYLCNTKDATIMQKILILCCKEESRTILDLTIPFLFP